MDNENEIKKEPNFILVQDEEPEVEFVLHKDQQGDDLKEPEGPKESNELNESNKKTKKRKEPKESPYVTRKFLIVALIVTMVLSTTLGACIAIVASGKSNSFKNLNYDNLASATGSELTVQEIVALNADAVVEILTETTSTNMFGQSSLAQGAGSGVIVNESGYIVTNNHVISGARSIQVTLHNGKEYSASVIGTDSVNDIAVLKIAANGLVAATIGDSTKLSVGDLAVAIGNPLGQLGGSATAGIISSLERRLTLNNTTMDLLQTDASINPGNSGGGLFNQKGELIGIVVAKGTGDDVEGLGFAIPISNVAEAIDDLIEHGTITSKPAIGVIIYDVTEQNTGNSGLEPGVYIQEVTGSQAKQAGLKAGDRIISINDKKISSSTDLISRVRKCKIGDTVTLVIMRDGKEKTIKTVLEDSTATQG